MLVAISEKEDIIKELGEESILRKFVFLSKYFNPKEQIDKTSKYSNKTVNAEKIFETLLFNFNPNNYHQDCQEFLSILIDNLHDEMKLIHTPQKEKEEVDDWKEVGDKS